MKKTLLKKIGIGILIGAMSLSMISCSGTADSKKNGENTSTAKSSLEEIKSKGKLVIGTSADYPPFEFHKEVDGKDEIVGTDIDIAKQVAKDLGVELEIKDMAFDGLLVALQSDKVDMVFACMTPTEERKKNVDFSDTYYNVTNRFIVRKGDETSISSIADLKGKKIGVQKGSIQEEIAKNNFDAANIKSLDKIPDLVLDLKNNKVDAVLAELPVAQININKNDGIAIANNLVIETPGGGAAAIALKKNSPELVTEVNKTLKKLEDENKIEEFMNNNDKLVD